MSKMQIITIELANNAQ